MLHWDKEKPFLKIAKNYHNAVGSLNILMINLIIVTTSSKKLLRTRNSSNNLQNQEISWQSRIDGRLRQIFPQEGGKDGAHLSTSKACC